MKSKIRVDRSAIFNKPWRTAKQNPLAVLTGMIFQETFYNLIIKKSIFLRLCLWCWQEPYDFVSFRGERMQKQDIRELVRLGQITFVAAVGKHPPPHTHTPNGTFIIAMIDRYWCWNRVSFRSVKPQGEKNWAKTHKKQLKHRKGTQAKYVSYWRSLVPRHRIFKTAGKVHVSNQSEILWRKYEHMVDEQCSTHKIYKIKPRQRKNSETTAELSNNKMAFSHQQWREFKWHARKQQHVYKNMKTCVRQHGNFQT